MKMMIFMLSLLIGVLMNTVLILSNKFKVNYIKLAPFECGFNSFEASRNPFSIQFFKILLIFLLFDMEIIVVLPIILFIFNFFFNNIIIIVIMIILMGGLFFEWREGSLDWLN